MYSIYRITNKINGKLYIGYSKRPEARWSDHKKYTLGGKKGVLYDTMRKHGINNFTFEIIFQSYDGSYIKDIMENFFIMEFNTRTPEGYNNAPGGQGGAIRTGYKHSDCTKAKISRANKGKKHSLETIVKMKSARAGRPGRPQSEKTKRIMSDKAKLRKYNPLCRSYVSGINNPTSKTYIISTPDNKDIQITNLTYFCAENNLHQGEMRKTLRGEARQHKGYRVVSIV